MRTSKKLAYIQKIEEDERQMEEYRQMAEAEAELAERRGRPVMVVPISTFSSAGRLIRMLQPFVIYAEPMNGGVLVTSGFTKAAGLGEDINEAIRKFLAGIEHRYLYMRLNTGSLAPGVEDELRSLSRFVTLK